MKKLSKELKTKINDARSVDSQTRSAMSLGLKEFLVKTRPGP